MDKEKIQSQITEIENAMSAADFWNDKNLAQAKIRDLQELKDKLEGAGKYDKGNAIITIFSGAGGDDAEDFSAMLLKMYLKYAERKGFETTYLTEHTNDHGGYRNVTIEVAGRGAYGLLKNESGVHRLVRISPFNANSKRQTSFSLVEVIPKLTKSNTEVTLPPEDLDISYARAGGPGGRVL